MQTKTIPFGTKMRATLLRQDVLPKYDQQVLLLEGEDEQGYVLIDKIGAMIPQGTNGEMEFHEGGPMGGHWIFTPDPASEKPT